MRERSIGVIPELAVASSVRISRLHATLSLDRRLMITSEIFFHFLSSGFRIFKPTFAVQYGEVLLLNWFHLVSLLNYEYGQ